MLMVSFHTIFSGSGQLLVVSSIYYSSSSLLVHFHTFEKRGYFIIVVLFASIYLYRLCSCSLNLEYYSLVAYLPSFMTTKRVLTNFYYYSLSVKYNIIVNSQLIFNMIKLCIDHTQSIAYDQN